MFNHVIIFRFVKKWEKEIGYAGIAVLNDLLMNKL